MGPAINFDTVTPLADLTLSPEQKMLRMTGMSATDIVRLSGLAPPCMGGPIDVYAEKTGDSAAPEQDIGEDLERGIFLESSLRSWYAHREGRHVMLPGTLQSPDEPLIFASPDGISFDPQDEAGSQRILEIKVPRYGFVWDEDEAPPYYRIQVQVQMGVSGIHAGDIVAMVNGSLRIYPQVFDPALYASLVAMAKGFWRDHVQAGVPPPPDASEAYGHWLARRHPADVVEEMVPADDDAMQWVQRYNAASAAVKEAEAQRREARNRLVATIGDYAGLCDADGIRLVTYKKCRDSAAVDYRALAASLPSTTLQRFATTKTGHRSIKVY